MARFRLSEISWRVVYPRIGRELQVVFVVFTVSSFGQPGPPPDSRLTVAHAQYGCKTKAGTPTWITEPKPGRWAHVRSARRNPHKKKRQIAGDERIQNGIALPTLVLHPYCAIAVVLAGCIPVPFKVRLTPQRGEGV